jgi:hypothetical protein
MVDEADTAAWLESGAGWNHDNPFRFFSDFRDGKAALIRQLISPRLA